MTTYLIEGERFFIPENKLLTMTLAFRKELEPYRLEHVIQLKTPRYSKTWEEKTKPRLLKEFSGVLDTSKAVYQLHVIASGAFRHLADIATAKVPNKIKQRLYCLIKI